MKTILDNLVDDTHDMAKSVVSMSKEAHSVLDLTVVMLTDIRRAIRVEDGKVYLR